MKNNRRAFLMQMGSAALSSGLLSKVAAQGYQLEGLLEDNALHRCTINAAEVKYSKVVIIGSGYGAAVAALRLAEAGIESTILEKGKAWTKKGRDGKVFCSPLNPDERAMWLNDKTTSPIKSIYGIPTEQKVRKGTGLIEKMSFNGIDVCMGRGVGGGSLVNMAMLVRADQEVLRKFLAPTEVDRFIQDHYPRAEKTLEANSIAPSYFGRSPHYKYARTAQAHLQRVGCEPSLIPSAYDFNYMQLEERGQVPRSALNYEVSYGNNYGKKSLDKTYLAKAFKSGKVRIATLTEVRSLRKTATGNYELEYLQREEKSGRVIGRGVLECSYLFLGAGSLGTTELLLRSRAQASLPLVPSEVGSDWGNNAEAFVAQNYSSVLEAGGQPSTVPAGASLGRDLDNERLLVMHLPMPVPMPHRIGCHVVMTRAEAKSQITFDSQSDSLVMKWGKEQDDLIKRKVKPLFDQANAVNKTKYNRNIFGNGTPFSTSSSYHPLGGCPLNVATNHYGELKNYENLFVIDGSLLPPYVGVNPALTITALAERNIELIITALAP